MATDLGVAYSGGGMTALLCTVCMQELMDSRYPDAGYAVSTASGGTLGYLLSAQDPHVKLVYPPMSGNFSALKYADLSKAYTNESDKSAVYFARVVQIIPGTDGLAETKAYRKPPVAQDWPDAIKALFSLAYKAPASSLSYTAPNRPYLVNFAAVRETSCPIKRKKDGVMVDPTHDLVHGIAELGGGGGGGGGAGSIPVVMSGNLTVNTTGLTLIDFMAFSSMFMAAGIVESQIQYDLLKGTLERITASSASGAASPLYALDGGMLDTTGIVTLLRRKTRRVVAFYNNNEGLTTLQSPMAYLFGVNVSTDTQNSLAGPVHTQVFDSALFPGVLRNLTGPTVSARLQDIAVLGNVYLGVDAYTLDELVIFSNQRSSAFLAEFADPAILQHLPKKWPDNIPVSMNPFEANMLCEFERWKFEAHVSELDRLFRQP